MNDNCATVWKSCDDLGWRVFVSGEIAHTWASRCLPVPPDHTGTSRRAGTNGTLSGYSASKRIVGCIIGCIIGCIAALPIMLAVGCDSTNAAFRTPQPAVVYLSFGDSTTAGPSTRDYTEFLSEKLNTTADRVANEGRGGETTEEGLIRLDDLIAFDLFPNARVFIYWEGGNDINDFIGDFDPFLLFTPDDPAYPFPNRLSQALIDITENVKRAVEKAQDAGMDAYVVTYYPLVTILSECPALPFEFILPGQAIHANVYVRLLNGAIRSAASVSGATVIDVAAIGDDLVADPANFFNCNHLSAVGNEIVAELMADELVASGHGPDAILPN